MRILAAFLIILVAALGASAWFLTRPPRSDATGPGKLESVASVPAPAPTEEYKLQAGVDIKFADVTRQAGIDFRHFDGRTDMEYIMDETGAGVAWLDYDQDGLLDLFFVQCDAIVPPYPNPRPTCKLYKNLGGGRFKDVTAEVGLAHVGFAQGAAVGDIDNDGFPDLFLTCYGKPNVLYRNVQDGKGGRRFVDATTQAGLGDHPDWHTRPNYSTSAAFLDYNNDGFLDLFVCSYVRIDMQHYPECLGPAGRRRGPCPPSRFEGTHSVLYRNNGNGTFTDVSKEAGIDQVTGKALGVVCLDLDGDGLTDIFVACDGVPNFLFRNLGNGTFESIGPMSGCAVNLAGTPQAYMGVDADDLHGQGRPDLYVTAFARETDTVFRNEGNCQFLDVTQGSGVGPPSWPGLAFGLCLLDADHDGNLDVFVSNGHVSRHIDEDGDPLNTFRQKPQFYRGDGKGRFHDISATLGPYFQEPHVGRAVAYGDFDNDGHMDLALNNSGEAAVLLHNETKTPYHWLRLELRGTKSNRDAAGACVTVHAGGRKIVRHRKGGGSYLSAHDPRLLIGLAEATRVDRVEIRWPGKGPVQVVGPLDVDRGYRITEGSDKAEPRP
jgi:hypothetical protein